ncbi:cytochrome P450 [Metabacillus sediminilitoris]|uniref:Cytochrome P450 n=1 Tax=Metabacillus sediminilitoris TaxID=2567941 RepID=A0A4S4BK44_9BACI|nr:cytochrome P450 [Metabacillus sediminilitoris]QGQ45891.1 cytochrome P450 [Metabacillus sediminilitoris]THF75073.1 cytochrome P450 [Metabacillus sediminilitoris]
MKTDVNQTISHSLISTEFFQNPYPFYEELRSIHSICWGNLVKNPGWYVTGYDEAITILKDTRFQNRIPLPQTSKKYECLKNIQHDMMLFKNQPDHKRLRFMVSNVFTPRMVEYLRPFIHETVNDLLHQFQHKKSMDVVSDFAFPLASLIIAKIIGVPQEERYQFKKWSADLIQTIDFTRSRTTLDNGNEMTIILRDYFKGLIKKRKNSPEEDLISLLIKAEQIGDRLTDEEVIATCILLVIAGHETTVNLISNSILTLLNHPQQLMELKEKSFLIEGAVEEFLRFESPTQMTARIASEDIKINQTTIKKGNQVYILLGAANRDPNKFQDAHLFDIMRDPNPHLAFGYGSHFCLGAPLARLEAQIAIKSLLAWKDNLQLAASDLQWRKLIGFRSLSELHITFD